MGWQSNIYRCIYSRGSWCSMSACVNFGCRASLCTLWAITSECISTAEEISSSLTSLRGVALHPSPTWWSLMFPPDEVWCFHLPKYHDILLHCAECLFRAPGFALLPAFGLVSAWPTSWINAQEILCFIAFGLEVLPGWIIQVIQI